MDRAPVNACQPTISLAGNSTRVAKFRIDQLKDEFGISDYTLYRWRRQARIDCDQSPGAKSYDFDPLLQARRRIKELEKELKATRATSALFEEGRTDPKGSSRLSEG
jgi:transposase-like protein